MKPDLTLNFPSKKIFIEFFLQCLTLLKFKFGFGREGVLWPRTLQGTDGGNRMRDIKFNMPAWHGLLAILHPASSAFFDAAWDFCEHFVMQLPLFVRQTTCKLSLFVRQMTCKFVRQTTWNSWRRVERFRW